MYQHLGPTNIFSSVYVAITLSSWLSAAVWPPKLPDTLPWFSDRLTLPKSEESIFLLLHSQQTFAPSLTNHFQWVTLSHNPQQKQKTSEILSPSHHFIYRFICTCNYFKERSLLFQSQKCKYFPRGQICHILLYSTPICILRIFVASSILPLSIHLW